jgi:multiple sugar transport system substrate-binding protein
MFKHYTALLAARYRLVGVTLAMLFLAACATVPAAGPAAPAQGDASAQAEGDLTGEITFLLWQNSPGMDELISETLPRLFEEEHPGATVNVTIVPYDQYNQKLALLVASGTPPDIFQSGPDFGRYVAEGAVIPLDDYIELDPVLNDPEKSRVDANDLMKVDRQHIYGAQNAALCGMQLYYNQDLFDQAGVDYPNADWTWDDFLAAAKALTIREGDEVVQWGTSWGYLPGWDGGWAPLVWSRGGEVFDSPYAPTEFYFDSPEVVASWQWMQDLVFTHEVAPPPAVVDVLDQAGGPLLSGKAAMVIDGCWMLGSYKNGDFKLGMSVVPQGPEGRVNVWWFAGGFAISSASEHKQLAWEFLRWLAVSEEANSHLAATGMSCGAPIVREFDELYAASWEDVPGGDACAQSLDNARYATIWSPKWAEIWDTVISPEWDKFTQGEITAQQLADAIQPQANAMLQGE